MPKVAKVNAQLSHSYDSMLRFQTLENISNVYILRQLHLDTYIFAFASVDNRYTYVLSLCSPENASGYKCFEYGGLVGSACRLYSLSAEVDKK